MFYEAGVEEFISLVKYSDCIVTNSFHGMILSIIYSKPFVVFSREQCDSKISELLDLLGINDRLFISGEETEPKKKDFLSVHQIIKENRKKSLDFLKNSLNLCL